MIRILMLILVILSLFSCKNKTEVQTQEDVTKDESALSFKIKELTDKINKSENNAELYYERAKLYRIRSRDLLAVTDMEKATKLDEKNITYKYFLAELYLKVSNTNSAIKTYEILKQLDPESDKPYIEIGRIYLYQAKPKECIESLNEALRRNKFNGEVYALKASYYLQMKDTARAISNLVTSVDVDPNYFESYIDLGYIYSIQKNPDGIVYLTNALRLKPDDKQALYNRGKLYQDLDSFAKAIMDYQKILMIDPDDRKANYNLAYIFFLTSAFDKAIQFFSTAIDIYPNYKEAIYGLGLSYDSLGNKEMAKENYEKLLKINPDDELVKQSLENLK